MLNDSKTLLKVFQTTVKNDAKNIYFLRVKISFADFA
jgi:hypothetical protein